MRELLEEAREILGDCYYHGKEPLSDGTWAKIAKTIKRITAALAEPEPDAMETGEYVVIVDDGFCRYEYTLNGSGKYSIHGIITIIENNTDLRVSQSRLLPEAAALIASVGHRVPRAMLEEIYQEGYEECYIQPIRNTKSQDIERIAAKHGVKMEG